MAVMAFRVALCIIIASLLAPSDVWGRTWTSRNGRTVEGDFVRLDGDHVVLAVSGKEVRVLLANLSDGDQAYAKLFNPGPPAPVASPPAADPGTPPASGAPSLAPTGPKEPPLPDLSRSRKWTDRSGRSVNAVLDNIIGDRVYLKVGTRTQTVNYQELCDEDQNLVRRYMEFNGDGLQVPAGSQDLPDQNLRSWRDKNDKSVLGILRRIEPDGDVVIQFSTRTAKFALENFSPADQEHIREEVASLGRGDLLPADDSVRTWRDWRGREFTGKLDPLFPVKSIGSSVTFKLSSGQRKTIQFVALCEEDREFLRRLAESQGGGDFLPDPFPEPDTEIRTWSLHDGVSSVEGKFVKVAGSSVVLRTETQSDRQCSLSSLSPEDRRYIEQILQSRGATDTVPLVSADCRKWVYGPAGRGNTVEAKFGDAAEGYVKLLLPNEYRIGKSRNFVVLPFLCLSEDDQERIKAEWTGDASALVPPDDVVTLDVRDWSLDEDQRAMRGKLLYVTHDSITVSEGGLPQKARFPTLSSEDMDYVQRVIALHGMAKFDPPPAPAGIVYSGVTAAESTPATSSQASTPTVAIAKSVPMSAYEVGVAVGYSLGFVLLLVTIAAILMKVLN
jgi:hypothetical protein